VLDRLWKGKRIVYRLRPRLPDRPAVIISHEPWGEAAIDLPGSSAPAVEVADPRIEGGAIRFITPDVAIVEGHCASAALLFVMKRDEGDWKIAALRMLAPD